VLAHRRAVQYLQRDGVAVAVVDDIAAAVAALVAAADEAARALLLFGPLDAHAHQLVAPEGQAVAAGAGGVQARACPRRRRRGTG
jgi:hypothetical protein